MLPSDICLALKENCLLTVLPSVFWSRIVPWPEADVRGAAAAVGRSIAVAAVAVINNPAKRNILVRFMVVSF
jgi:hypothetical protein